MPKRRKRTKGQKLANKFNQDKLRAILAKGKYPCQICGDAMDEPTTICDQH